MKNWKWWVYIRYFYNCYLIGYSSPQKHYWFISVARALDGMADQVRFFFLQKLFLYQARTLTSFSQGLRTVLVGTLYLGAKTLIMGFPPPRDSSLFCSCAFNGAMHLCTHRLAELESVQHVIFVDIFVPYQCAQRGSWKIAFLFLPLLSTFRSGDFT